MCLFLGCNAFAILIINFTLNIAIFIVAFPLLCHKPITLTQMIFNLSTSGRANIPTVTSSPVTGQARNRRSWSFTIRGETRNGFSMTWTTVSGGTGCPSRSWHRTRCSYGLHPQFLSEAHGRQAHRVLRTEADLSYQDLCVPFCQRSGKMDKELKAIRAECLHRELGLQIRFQLRYVAITKTSRRIGA